MPDRPIHRRLITPPSVLPSKNFGILPQSSAWLKDNPFGEALAGAGSLHQTRQEAFTPLPAKVLPGLEIGGFRIVGEIGSGGTASIYRAVQASGDRVVALKVLSPHLSHVPAAVERFRREADLAGRLDHPGIVPIFGSGSDKGYHFYSMKLLDGPTLAEFIDQAEGIRGEGFFRDASTLFAAVARTLAALHSKGIIHQDIKPGNLILSSDENAANRLVLTDFGIAAEAPAEMTLEAPEQQPLLQGTPAYMAPEKFIPGRNAPDHRADIYALGLCLFELATGVLPFPECSDEEMASLKLNRRPPSPRSILATVPLGLEAILRQAIDSHILLRYQNAGEMALDLERFANNRRPNTRKHTSPPPANPTQSSPDDDADPDLATV